MHGWWDAAAVDQLLARAIRGSVDKRLPELGISWLGLKARVIITQSRQRSLEVGALHYDEGVDLYRRMLDPLMLYR